MALPVGSAIPALELRGVSKRFARRGAVTPALEATDLAVRNGEFVALVGPSGCGKSTLLNLAAGFLVPDSGEITANGQPIVGPAADRCVLFQSPTLFPWLTARDNVLFGPRARGQDRREATGEAEHLLQAVGLSGFADHYPHQLSGGMRHRVALARALINRPHILLMDEPFASLDAITRASMQAFLLDLWQRERMTILFVTHDVEEATLLADRVCIMSRTPGRITDVVEIALPRPRDYATTETPEFVLVRKRVRGLLVNAMAEAA